MDLANIRLSDVPPDLDSLIDNWFRYADRRTHVRLRAVVSYNEFGPNDAITADRKGATEMRVSIFTDKNEYKITAIWACARTYLGCIATSRKPRAGEEHTRGSDLSDGPFTYETWFRILADIVSYELVEIAKSQRPVPDGHAFPFQEPAGGTPIPDLGR